MSKQRPLPSSRIAADCKAKMVKSLDELLDLVGGVWFTQFTNCPSRWQRRQGIDLRPDSSRKHPGSPTRSALTSSRQNKPRIMNKRATGAAAMYLNRLLLVGVFGATAGSSSAHSKVFLTESELQLFHICTDLTFFPRLISSWRLT